MCALVTVVQTCARPIFPHNGKVLQGVAAARTGALPDRWRCARERRENAIGNANQPGVGISTRASVPPPSRACRLTDKPLACARCRTMASDRKSVVQGKSVSVRVVHVGRGHIKKK